MRQGQTTQSRVRHQRSVGRYHSPYQRGGSIIPNPPNPWGMENYYDYELEPWITRRVQHQRGGTIIQPPFNPWGINSNRWQDERWINDYIRNQRGGNVHPVIYPWQKKGRKRINRRRQQP